MAHDVRSLAYISQVQSKLHCPQVRPQEHAENLRLIGTCFRRPRPIAQLVGARAANIPSDAGTGHIRAIR